MLAFLKALILLPIALVVILLAVANRAPVLLSLDPFTRAGPQLSVTVPLYALVFGAVALGVVVGGLGAWLGQSRNRRAKRRYGRELNQLRSESERLRSADRPRETTGSTLPATRSW